MKHDLTPAFGQHYHQQHSQHSDISNNILQDTAREEMLLRITEAYWIRRLQPRINRNMEYMGTFPTSVCTCGIHIPPQICRCSQFRSASSSTYSTKRASGLLLLLHSVQQSCAMSRSCAFRVTSMSNFIICAERLPTCQGERCPCRAIFFTNMVNNCHNTLCHKHTKVICIAAPASLRH